MGSGQVTDEGSRLAQLETEERTLSSRRRRLHDRIDFIRSGRGVDAAGLDMLLEEERRISARRRELHAEIDTLRTSLGMAPGPRQSPRLLGA